ncbi:MAG: glycosyltransferase family 87 protein [Acidimicrobiia bacterium]
MVTPHSSDDVGISEPRPSRLVVGVVVVLGFLAATYTAYLWMRYLVSIDIAGTVGARAGRDFRAFAVAGSLADAGNVSDLYDPSAASYVAADASAFVYPPWFAASMIPISMASFQTGYWIWLSATSALAAASLVLVDRRFGFAAFGALLASAAGLQTMLFGQSAFLILALGGVVAWAVAARRHLVAGSAAALMAFKPQLLLGLAIVWVWKRDRFGRSIIAALALSSVLYVGSEMLLSGSWFGWATVIANSSSGLVAPTAEITLGSAARLLVGEGVLGDALVVGFVLGGVVWLATVLHRRDLEDGTLLFAAFGMSIVVSLHALLYDVLVLVPALLIIWAARPAMRFRVTVYGVATISLLTIGPIAVAAQLEVFGRAVAVGPLALAAFVVWLVEAVPRHSRSVGQARDGIPEPAGG